MTGKNPNPQGKGLTPVLENLLSTRAQFAVPQKPVLQIVSELFTSMFILESGFKFKPVVGQSYWLYWKRGQFSLSLIAPHECTPTLFGKPVGECRLLDDLTWTLTLSEAAADDEAIQTQIEQRLSAFQDMLDKAEKVDDVLPVFVKDIPFYPRVFASALANSLKISLQKGGLLGMAYADARQIDMTNGVPGALPDNQNRVVKILVQSRY